MASLYRRSGSKVWQAAFYVPTPNGEAKQVRRSTGKTKRKEAERVAIELEKASRDLAGLSDEKGKRIHAIINQAGEDALRERLTVTKARAYLSAILKESSGEELSTYTLRGWIDEWLKRKHSQVSTATLRRYEGSCRAFLKWLGKRAKKPLESVTTQHIREFRDSIREGRTARTCNHYVKDISSIFGAAISEGLIQSNPVSPLKALPLTDSSERLPFSNGEVQRLVTKAPSEDWRGVILIGAYTGLRLGDCAGLAWGNVDLNAGTLTIVPKKTKRKGIEVRIPLAAPLRDFLESHPIADDPKAPVFPSLAEVPISGNSGLSIAFGDVMEMAGVSRGEKRQSGMHERSFHALRHTFTSWLANAGVSPELRQAMTGHLDSESHKLYTHHELASLQGAIERLPGMNNE